MYSNAFCPDHLYLAEIVYINESDIKPHKSKKWRLYLTNVVGRHPTNQSGMPLLTTGRIGL